MKRFAWLSFCLIGNVLAAGETITDGSLGAKVNLGSGSFEVSQNLGTTVGNNLFHSFSQFNINTDQTATFTGASNLQNIITRVTGGEVSNIDGLLKSAGKADFYFINPAGIIFGKNAAFDITGSINISTADYLKLGENGLFKASNSTNSQLSIVDPTHFGFLGSAETHNGLLTIQAQLNSHSDEELNFVAGNMAIKDGSQLISKTGEVRLIAVQNPHLIDIEELPIELSNSLHGGTIYIENNQVKNSIDTSGDGGGEIEIWGGDVTFNKANSNASNTGTLPVSNRENVNIIANRLTLNDSIIAFDSFDTGNGGNVSIKANQLRVDGQGDYAEISSESKGAGNAGDIAIESQDVVIAAGGEISANATGNGNAGNIQLNAKFLTIDGTGEALTRISSQTSGKGNAGDVVIEVENIDVKNGGKISSDTLPISTEVAQEFPVGNDLTHQKGKAGIVSINAKQLTLSNGAKISSDSLTDGEAGTVQINAENLIIDGKGQYTEISSEAQHSGKGGEISVIAKNLTVLDYGQIASDSIAQGKAGDVTVHAQNLIIDGKNHEMQTGISSDTSSVGAAGNVSVFANQLTLKNNATISSKSVGADSSGQTGAVKISVLDNLFLKNSKISMESEGLVDFSTHEIVANPISVSAKSIFLDNSSITTQATGNTESGNISVDFSTLTANHSFIQTDAQSNNGGSIFLTGNQWADFKNSGLLTTVHTANGNGGDINANISLLILETGVIQANAESGNGGNIHLNIDALIPSENLLIKGGQKLTWQADKFGFNLIQAASNSGMDGNIYSSAPQLNLSGVIANFGQPHFESMTIKQDFCDSSSGSSLTQVGNGGLRRRISDLRHFF